MIDCAAPGTADVAFSVSSTEYEARLCFGAVTLNARTATLSNAILWKELQFSYYHTLAVRSGSLVAKSYATYLTASFKAEALSSEEHQ